MGIVFVKLFCIWTRSVLTICVERVLYYCEGLELGHPATSNSLSRGFVVVPCFIHHFYGLV